MRCLMISVDVEDWYCSRWFNKERFRKAISEEESNLLFKESVNSVLEFFNEINVLATFFVLGKNAERSPDVIEGISSHGHEVACHGYTHDDIDDLGKEVFREHLEKAKSLIFKASGYNPVGYRAPNFGISTEAINILEENCFNYDSSITPCRRVPGWYGHPKAPLIPYRPSRFDMCRMVVERDFFEVPLAVLPFLRLPGGGGWFTRNVGLWWIKTVIKSLFKRGPVTIYVYSWEFHGNNPRLPGIPFHVFHRTGQYVKMAIRSIVDTSEAKLVTIRDFIDGYS